MTAFVAVFRQLYCVSAAKTDAGRPSSFSRYRVSTVNTFAYVCDKLSEIKMDAFVSKLKNNPIKYCVPCGFICTFIYIELQRKKVQKEE